jgi:hypothetical protein
VTGWGAEQLTREDLLNLGAKLRGAWDASVRQANRGADASQMRQSFAVAAELRSVLSDVADELIVRGWGAAADREAEAGS